MDAPRSQRGVPGNERSEVLFDEDMRRFILPSTSARPSHECMVLLCLRIMM
jgi:hypothetical protein